MSLDFRSMAVNGSSTQAELHRLALLRQQREQYGSGNPQPGMDENKQGETDWASLLTWGMFSLAHSTRHRDLSDQMESSTIRKWKRKGVSVGAQEAMKGIGWKLDEALYDTLGLSNETKKVLLQNNDQLRAYSAAGLFGLGRDRVKWEGLTWEEFRKAQKANFKEARFVPQVKEVLKNGKTRLVNPTFTGWLKNGFGGELIRRISEFAATGVGAVEAAIGALGLGFLITNTVLTMKKAADISSQKQDNGLTTIYKVGYAGFIETMKNLVAIQATSIAYAVTYAAIPLTGVGAAAAMASGAIGGVLAYNHSNKILGASVEKDPAKEFESSPEFLQHQSRLA